MGDGGFRRTADQFFQAGLPRSIWRGLLSIPTPAPTTPPTTMPGGPPITPIPAPMLAPDKPRSPVAVPQADSNILAAANRIIRFIIGSPKISSKTYAGAKSSVAEHSDAILHIMRRYGLGAFSGIEIEPGLRDSVR